MDPDRYQLVKRVFRQVCDAAPDQRSALLEHECGGDRELIAEVESLLTRDEASDNFLGNAPTLDRAQILQVIEDVDAVPSPRPQRIGQYRICDVLGEGGMGVVYLAEQDNPRRPVALKVIRPGVSTPSMLKRFEYEAHLLGRLHHPGIAQIYEAGTADAGAGPQPFFAMELVRGQPLTEFAAKRQLTIRDRLHLLVKVCHAVHHAHQKGVIHRDLKPGNILVEMDSAAQGAQAVGAAAQPKILDFGVARAIDSDAANRTLHTSAGELIGTIAYMSPEQLSGDVDDIDIRADVYSLGVIFYELLAGRLPHDLRSMRLPERIRTIQEAKIAPLGRVNRALRGDLETIVAKALEKDRARRYQSALELAEDVRRFLSDQPIAARPPSAVYQFRKFAQRNKAMVTGVLLAAVVGPIALSVHVARLSEANARLPVAFQAAREMEDPLKPAVTDLDRMRAVRLSARDLERSDPATAADFQSALGLNFMKLASYSEAREALEKALAIRTRFIKSPHADLADSHYNLGRVLWYAGEYAASAEASQRALEMWQTLSQRSGDVQMTRDVGRALDQLASCYRKLGDLQDAERFAREALAL